MRHPLNYHGVLFFWLFSQTFLLYIFAENSLSLWGFGSATEIILEMMGIDSRINAKLKGKITAIMGCDD
jgi:hypothetical protein